eukprot:scaffold2345_cov51-Attheya_sp.AAC.2
MGYHQNELYNKKIRLLVLNVPVPGPSGTGDQTLTDDLSIKWRRQQRWQRWQSAKGNNHCDAVATSRRAAEAEIDLVFPPNGSLRAKIIICAVIAAVGGLRCDLRSDQPHQHSMMKKLEEDIA